MLHRRRLAWHLRCAVLLGVAGAALAGATLAGATVPATASDDPSPIEPSYQGTTVDRVVMEASVDADGDAHWTVEHRIRLDDANATDGFEGTRDRVESNRTAFRAPFADRVAAMAANAEATTGRPMAVENVSVEVYREQLPREYGVVAYEFDWYGFAAADETLRVGDGLSGLFLDRGTTLIVSWSADAELAEASPTPDETRATSVAWDGPLEFATGEPRVVLASSSTSFGSGPVGGAGGDDLLVLTGLLGVVAAGSGTGVVVWRRRTRGGPDSAGSDSAQDPTDSADEDSTDAADENSTDSADENSTGSATDDSIHGEETAAGASDTASTTPAAGPSGERPPGVAEGDPADVDGAAADATDDVDDADSTDGADSSDDAESTDDPAGTAGAGRVDGAERADDGHRPDGVERASGADEPEAGGSADDRSAAYDDELLSNEERVLALLEARGGRAKQQDVIDALDWSETKTSEVVSELREGDAVDVFRIGRENVLALPETGLGLDDSTDEEDTGVGGQ